MFWRLHTEVLGRQVHEAFNYLRELGDQVQIVTGPVLTIDPVPEITFQPAVAITTLQDARKYLDSFAGGCTIRLFYNESDYALSRWLPKLGDPVPILNSGGIIDAYSMLTTIPRNLLETIASPSGEIFIKPDNRHELFSGLSFPIEKFRDEILTALRPLDLNSDLPCYLAMHRELKDIEWRLWIVNREVVCHSPYSRKGEVCWSTVPKKVLDVAKAVAKNEWQPDIAYVVDIVETISGDVFVEEINAASTSNVYSAPITDLLFAFRLAVHEELANALTFG